MSSAITSKTLRRTAEDWLSKDDGQPALALRAAASWDGDPVLSIASTPVRIVACATPLAVRAALHDRESSERLVLLTPLSDDDLGDALLAHLSRYSVRRVDIWDVVENLFGGVKLESRIRNQEWLGEALIDFAPVAGWPRVSGTHVTRDHALRCLASQVLGIERETIDIAGLLDWSGDLEAQQSFVALPDGVRTGLTKYLAEVAGRATSPIMAAAAARHGVDVIPLGLLAAVLWASAVDQPSTDVMVARTRLELRFGGKHLQDQDMRSYAAAAEAWLDRVLDTSRPGLEGLAASKMRRAEAIAQEIGAEKLLGGSARLPAGFRQRMHAFADEMRLAVPRGLAHASPMAVARVEKALSSLEEHRAAEDGRIKRARMAVRLLRWLSIPDGAAPRTLYDALLRQVGEDGWVDRARLSVMAGDLDVGDAYRILHHAADARRAKHDSQFAQLLAADTRADVGPGRLLRVEDVLERVIKPIVADRHRVLLVLLDGMSVAAATELAESLSSSWLELTPGGEHRTGVLAALPTITQVSRCSLFSGKIAVGERADEIKALAKALPDSVLLHKGGLRAGAGHALPDDLIDEVYSNRAVVAAVINTIDDALDRGDPGTAEWAKDRILDLQALLHAAEDRVVILVSDHGHVIDRGTDSQTLPSTSSENRWRPADPGPREGEVLLAGPRVALGGGQIVVPWREEIRYGPRKAGYHGGGSPAEAVIPLIMLVKGEKTVSGWAPAPVSTPLWWREPVAAPVAQAPKRNQAVTSPGQTSLFEVAAQESTLADAVLSSDLYKARDNGQLTADRTRALLNALIRAPQQRLAMETLADYAAVPAHRIRGTITALRKVLQVEGYPVLTVDSDGASVRLDLNLLREQFGVAG